ncbi:IgGFc-binding protein-like [Synchiropus picturatus]
MLQRQLVTPNSAIHISSSKRISVVSFNRQSYTGDGAVVYPTDKLGSTYYAYTPKGGLKSMDKLLAIVNGPRPNMVKIIPSADVSINKRTKWRRKKPVSYHLAPYASLLVRSRTSLTGTGIFAKTPLAVLAGNRCLKLKRFCEHVYEQLPPVSLLGTEYMVPKPGQAMSKNWAAIVAVEDNTDVTINKCRRPQKQKLPRAGTHTVVAFHRPMIVQSNKPVMVLLVSDNHPHDPFMLTLTPSSRLASGWTVETLAGLSSTVAIVSEREGAHSVRVCSLDTGCRPLKWNPFRANKERVWSNVKVGHSQSHVTVSGDAQMAVYVYGGKHRHGYGTAGVCADDSPPPTPPPDPCEKVKCRVMQNCVGGKCVHASTATCHAVGDPHYMTFDGRRFDFQGSCTYIMTTVTKTASDLVPFTVTTKNNHRGNRRVSYVKTVSVHVYNHVIVIGSRKVLVDEERQNLPITLSGGRITVKKIFSNYILTTDFGLTVKYDCNMRLYITVTSSYYHHLGGLCGNYNGDKRDDLPEPAGSSLSSVLAMIQKWKVKDSDLFCHDNCGGQCPKCSKPQQIHYSQINHCGILVESGGPFSRCHKDINPAIYLDNCVYDLCINTGSKQILCDSLNSYHDACVSKGLKVDVNWRKEVKCPILCPPGSHYEECGSACPASCSFPNSEKQCKALCVDGCQCDKGLVLSGDKCVPKSSCGCQYQDKYYLSGTSFWEDKKCTRKCRCLNQQVQCTSKTCKKNEHCALRDGVRDCYPVSYTRCQSAGDPHYQTFDKRRFNFQGTCTYVLSQLSKSADKELEPFRVLVQNEHRGSSKAVSYTKSFSITLFGNITISMSRSSPGVTLVNNRPVNLPYILDDGKLTVVREGYFAVVKTYFGLKLWFNWGSHVSMRLPSTYASATEGLCGNNNGKPNDDLIKPDGQLAANDNVFGDSWKVGGEPGCTSKCTGDSCPHCTPGELSHYRQRRFCGIIADKSGPFGDCHSKVKHEDYMEDCVFDLCMYEGHVSALCIILSTFSNACQEVGARLKPWRTDDFCPSSCGANSHYELCPSICQPTCSSLTVPEDCEESGSCVEACVCDDGFLLSNDKCVPIAECGCQYDGQYYQIGQAFFPLKSCDTRCECSDNGAIECDAAYICPENEKCVVNSGQASCVYSGLGSCSVFGMQTIQSFDGKVYPLWGDCWFHLSEVEVEAEGRPAFSVSVLQQSGKDGRVTRNVELEVYDIGITMETGVIGEIKVDDDRTYLPVYLSDGRIRVHQNGINIIIETDFGLSLSYDTVASILLQIPSTYAGSPTGLCGNYNADICDETEDPAKFVVNETTPCEVGCGRASCPKPDRKKIPEAESKCDIIRAWSGPFARCHSTVSASTAFDACVRELSMDGGGADTLCRHIQHYVTACQRAGIQINEWRTKDFCPVTCPSGSSYKLCSSSCSSTCFSLEKADSCPVCQEGCQTDNGLMWDGNQTVSVDKCGCVLDGRYYKSGRTMLLNDCSESCTCQSGQFKCSPASCKKGEECSSKNGVFGCYATVQQIPE